MCRGLHTARGVHACQHACRYADKHAPTRTRNSQHAACNIAVNQSVTTLLLAGNPFGDRGGLYLAEKLCKNNLALSVRTTSDWAQTDV